MHSPRLNTASPANSPRLNIATPPPANSSRRLTTTSSRTEANNEPTPLFGTREEMDPRLESVLKTFFATQRPGTQLTAPRIVNLLTYVVLDMQKNADCPLNKLPALQSSQGEAGLRVQHPPDNLTLPDSSHTYALQLIQEIQKLNKNGSTAFLDHLKAATDKAYQDYSPLENKNPHIKEALAAFLVTDLILGIILVFLTTLPAGIIIAIAAAGGLASSLAVIKEQHYPISSKDQGHIRNIFRQIENLRDRINNTLPDENELKRLLLLALDDLLKEKPVLKSKLGTLLFNSRNAFFQRHHTNAALQFAAVDSLFNQITKQPATPL